MLSKIYHAVTARLVSYKVMYYLRNMQRAGIDWKKVEDIWLPIWPSIGFDTLRWIVNGNYEQGEISILKRKLSKTDIMLEIGTGLGFIASYCAQKIGSDKVITFEVNPQNVEIARQVFSKNNVNPTLHHLYLGENKGHVNFILNENSRLASSVFIQGGSSVTVEQISLNETIRKYQPTYLVMDIEGAEYDIIRIIDYQSIKKIQFELHPKLIGEEKTNFIFHALDKAGFTLDNSVSFHPNYYFSKK